MKLELKHLLPYGDTLNFMWDGIKVNVEGYDFYREKIILERVGIDLSEVNPILRPLSEYKNIPEIVEQFSELDEEHFILSFLSDLGRPTNCFDHINYTQAQLMFKHHLDLFGLIEKGLAENYNTLKKQ